LAGSNSISMLYCSYNKYICQRVALSVFCGAERLNSPACAAFRAGPVE
jgi:hypothetical protein